MQVLGKYQDPVREAALAWSQSEGTARLWDRDATLWSDSDESAWLGWLNTITESQSRLSDWQRLAKAVQNDGIEQIVVLGMGGSSLCPEVLAETLPAAPNSPRLRVLDSTVPAEVRSLSHSLDLARTLFVVSSKSGTTIEANVLLAHFFAATQEALGSASDTGRHFIAITDRGTPLEELAASLGFRHCERGVATIGGRFSALSPFGMLPATLAGIDTEQLLARAARMAQACRPTTRDDSNPGVQLGIAIAALAREGRDKLTLVAPPALASIGTWLEQLVAESTGKGGQGIVPISGEALAAPDRYGDDRVFVYAQLTGGASGPDEASNERDAALARLENAGHPTIRLEISDPLDLAAEFYRWEFAIAVAGSLLGLNPFDQPDVEAAKVAARELTDSFVRDRALPADTPQAVVEEVALFADPAFRLEAANEGGLVGVLAEHFGRIGAGDYFAISAFVAMSERNRASLQRIRSAVQNGYRVATTLGFGPRFLHSTGQLHKGGPNSGVFLQITADDDADLEIPDHDFSFGVLKQAQSLGDFRVLVQRGRRALRLHLGPAVEDELERLAGIAERAAQSSCEETT